MAALATIGEYAAVVLSIQSGQLQLESLADQPDELGLPETNLVAL